MDEITASPATALAALIAARELSAVEVVEAHLRRIAEVNPAINAVVALDEERALAAARTAPAGPLHGVPFTVKDNIAAAGLPMAIGAPERAGVVPDADATVVARLKLAGAILLGKTNCPPYGGGIETDNEVYGRTNNPYDVARTPGGSSGGEAAIVAAGGSPCGLGTDSGASVRLPAHFCGLASIKPTAQRVPVTGVLDDEGQIGALERSAHAGRRARAVGRRRRAAAAAGRGPGRARRRRRAGAARRSRGRRAARAARRGAHGQRPRTGRRPRPSRRSSAPPLRCATPARSSRRPSRRAAATS